MKKYINILWYALAGNLFKIRVWICVLLNIPPRISKNKLNDTIVSLTSYGYRIKNSLPYVLFSLLKQTVLPERIMVYLGENEKSENDLPFLIKKMQKWQMFSILYYKDIRSYKKLIPALKDFPDKNIIVVDDDIYYSSNLIKELYNRHLQMPDKICALNFYMPTFQKDGTLATYSLWKKYYHITAKQHFDENLLFPVGFGGVFYPPNAFDPTVFDEKGFMKLSPLADDIWFYAMAIKNKTLRTWIPNSSVKYYSVW